MSARQTIAIIDYGAGNLRSVTNTLTHLGADVVTIATPDGLAGAGKIVLPGVGAFGAGIAALRRAGFEEPLKDAVAAGVPLIGICLGMQYLFEASDEMGDHRGLGLLPGHVRRFPTGGPKVPHIGWNQLHIRREHPLLAGVKSGAYAYFVPATCWPRPITASISCLWSHGKTSSASSHTRKKAMPSDCAFSRTLWSCDDDRLSRH